MKDINACPICRTELPAPVSELFGRYRIGCSVCGEFSISTDLAQTGVAEGSARSISGALREIDLKRRSEAPFVLDDPADLLASVRVANTAMEKLDKLLLSVDRMSEYFGQEIQFDCDTDYPLAYAYGKGEVHKLVVEAVKLGFLGAGTGTSTGQNYLQLTLKGAERLDILQRGEVKSDQIFVAMSFSPMADKIYQDGIKPAIEAALFSPMRIDKKEHDNKIDDEIIAEINKSALVVADFTCHRPNVYYEAGYARGRQIRVIHTCKKGYVEQAHLDTRQFSHIVWEDAEELKDRLFTRIQADPNFLRMPK